MNETLMDPKPTNRAWAYLSSNRQNRYIVSENGGRRYVRDGISDLEDIGGDTDMVDVQQRMGKSKEDLTGKISKTVFVTNFPDHITARDLWNVCTAYGKVVDVYIPLKRSKTGKKFAFVRFLKVDNMERLIENLCTIWIGRFHLHANPGSPSSDSSPAIVMDDSCIVDNDLSCSLMGKIKDINALSNIYVIFADEGFDNVNISIYLGGFWILIEACSVASKEKMLNHEGLASWFSELCIADPSFVSEDRLVWISIEGLPFNTWNNNAYAKIISQWELEAWAPEFNNEFCENSSSDEESMEDGEFNSQKVDDIDHISESSCMKEGNEQQAPKTGKESEDPFGIYSILKRNNQKEKSKDAGKSDPSFPPGFTPKGVNETIEEEENVSVNKSNSNHHCNKKTGSNGKCGSNRSFKLKAGGSILDVMEDLIEIGHAMGSKKDWIRELNLKYKVNFATIQETKSEKIDLFAIKSLWGNFNFDFVYSPSVGLSAVRGSETIDFGTIFNDIGAKAFNHFISSSCLIDLPLEGYSFTWALKSGSKMSKLDRFLISEGLISIFPSLAAMICLIKRLTEHIGNPLRESSDGFDNLIADTWNNLSIMETNKISLLRKKFQALKAIIKNWSRDEMLKASAVRHSAQISLLKDIHDLDKRHSSDLAQKAKIQWAIEGDENSKYFHGIINKKWSQLAIRGVLVDGEWIEDPPKVKNEFLEHFSNRFFYAL
ncbi:RNA-directed DNA polymerase, eukaryota [Tanacetum coccineum]